jgi:hypothetical protein
MEDTVSKNERKSKSGVADFTETISIELVASFFLCTRPGRGLGTLVDRRKATGRLAEFR